MFIVLLEKLIGTKGLLVLVSEHSLTVKYTDIGCGCSSFGSLKMAIVKSRLHSKLHH